MPSRKQRRRAQKERRHEYETVWVDAEGNELEEPPEEVAAGSSTGGDGAKRNNGKPKSQPQRGGRAGRVPSPPSWERAARRSLILGAVIFALFFVLGAKNGGHNIASALGLAGLYTLLFIPFTYFLDRFAYNRFQRRAGQQGQKGQAKKR
jgi:hypothetical protein